MWRAAPRAVVLVALLACAGCVGAAQRRLTRAAAEGKHVSLREQLGLSDLINQPDESGSVALVEAARNGHLDAVTVLLQHHASVHAPDPRTGASALQLAVENGHLEVARALLAYSADPDLEDKFGTSPRLAGQGNDEVERLLEIFDERGAEAFEDAPGTYLVDVDPITGGKTYTDSRSGAVAAATPPSCAWTHALIQGHPFYFNTVTQQSTWIRPIALCWKYVDYIAHDGKRHVEWFNWRTNLTLGPGQYPVELPQSLVEQGMAEKNVYWFNTVTNDRQWYNPLADGWREVTGSLGEKRWYHAMTLEMRTTEPEELGWREVLEGNSKRPFFWNKVTGQTQWQVPDVLAWTQHSDL